MTSETPRQEAAKCGPEASRSGGSALCVGCLEALRLARAVRRCAGLQRIGSQRGAPLFCPHHPASPILYVDGVYHGLVSVLLSSQGKECIWRLPVKIHHGLFAEKASLAETWEMKGQVCMDARMPTGGPQKIGCPFT